jgi:hypothetical protein
MARSEAQGKASMFPGTIHVIASIVTTRIVTDPFAIAVHVRDLWMSLEISKIPLVASPLIAAPLIRLALFGGALLLHGSLPLFGSPLLRSSLPGRWRRTVRWDISATNATLVPVLLSPTPLSAAVPFLRNTRNCKAHRE